MTRHPRLPLCFDDYDDHCSFASFISQAPILLGPRLNFDRVVSYSALYHVGAIGIPAASFMVALVLSWPQPRLFALVAAAAVVFGFGLNWEAIVGRVKSRLIALADASRKSEAYA